MHKITKFIFISCFTCCSSFIHGPPVFPGYAVSLFTCTRLEFKYSLNLRFDKESSLRFEAGRHEFAGWNGPSCHASKYDTVPRKVRGENPLKNLLRWRSPRTPKEFTTIFNEIESKLNTGQNVTFIAFEQLWKRLGSSARAGALWADMEKASLLEEKMLSAGYSFSSDCYRNLLQVAAEECWRGNCDRSEIFNLIQQARTYPDVQVRESLCKK